MTQGSLPLNIAALLSPRQVRLAETGDLSDNSLIKQALDGKVSSFKILVERYNKKAYLYARGMIGNRDDALDLSQEAFIRVYKNLNKFDQTYPFGVWFFTILANLCKNHLRSRYNKGENINSEDYLEAVPASESLQPDQSLFKTENQRMVWEAISELPAKFREIIMLCHFQDMSYDQIAKALNMPRGSVMSRLYYARKNLREILEKKGVEL